MKTIKNSSSLKRLLNFVVVAGILGYYAGWSYQKRLLEINFPEQYLGIIFAISILLEIFFMSAHYKLDFFIPSKQAQFKIYGVILSVGFLMSALSTNYWIVAIGFILSNGLGWSIGMVSLNYSNKHIQSSERATVLSTMSMAKQGLIVFLNPIYGFFMGIQFTMLLGVFGFFGLIWAMISKLETIDVAN
jgi:hypothetical protein